MIRRLLLTLALAAAAACGDQPAGGAPDAGSPDADVPDADVPDADVPDAGPFPIDPHAGQFAWAVLIPGLSDQVVMATGPDGSIFVAATHNAPVDVGEVHLPAPVGSAIAVVKLDPRARPIWARSLGGGDPTWRTNARSATVAANGDVVVSGAFVGAGFDAGTGPLPSVSAADGFVARLDGATGTTRWARAFAGGGEDVVSSVAADPTTDDVYLFGELAGQTVDGAWQPGFAFLERLDPTGAPVWSRQLPLRLSWQHAMSLDAQLGPVVSGRYDGVLEVDGFHLEVEPGDERGNLAVIGFSPAGRARFARQIFDEHQGNSQRLLATPGGPIYVAATTEAQEIVLDDGHGLMGPDVSSDAVVIRLTADGVVEDATLIDAEVAAYPHALAADADGAIYLASTCDRGIAVTPAITCAQGGSFLASYGPSGEYRWSTYIYGSPAWAEALAAVPGENRLLVAGEVAPIAGSVDFGGVQVQGAGLFVASLVTGPTFADPSAPVPVVTSVALEGVFDGQLRQGGTGVVTIRGDHLDSVHRVRIGSRDLFPTAIEPGTLRFTYVVPHGEALGPVPLVLEHPRGRLSFVSALEISPIVVAPSGTDTGRGTRSSPWRLCRDDWQTVARRGDTIRILAGSYPCEQSLYLQRGVIVEGAGAATTRLGVPGRRFGPFFVSDGPHGTTRLSGLTFLSGDFGAISMFDGVADLAVHDVDFVGLTTPGLSLDFVSGRVAVDHIRYLDGRAPAIYANGGLHLEGRALTIETTSTGVRMRRGRLTLRDSSIAAGQTAIELGNDNDPTPAPRHLILERSTLSAARGVSSYGADLELVDSDLVGPGDDRAQSGIELVGGTLTLRRTRLRGFWDGIRKNVWGLGNGPSITNLDLDGADIVVPGAGVAYFGGGFPAESWLRMRRSTIAGATTALQISAEFASVDLGTAAAPGANALSSSPSGHALVDNRDSTGPAIEAAGTTLNGTRYSGSLVGPRDDADLVQRAANVVRF